MKRYLFFLVFLLTNIYSNSNAQSTRSDRKPIAGRITSYSVDKAYLGMNISDLKKEYSDYTISEDCVCNYGIDGEEKGVLIIKGNEKIMFVWLNYGEETIKGIFCLTDNFETENKIKIGTTLQDLLNLYPKLFLRRDCLLMKYEYTNLENLGVNIQFLTNDKNRVGKYDTDDCQEKSFTLNKTKRIERIEI